ncbi:hypothetical protein PPERSA_09031 [Pseudocohnilembus persalinus]|uniref:Uncharacterized protein n=1 Tax=Pseudocohnilembus persalinus TaxID=266149 RepID=A0A0V0R346_PSEPJ|nr:hypothetical protein PPERSA_09031 [Pseudocohnilembus persalinus]|eukprot:KRX08927.1 hypothetical protein PPERSA_09031 [Pseudocohnilembus persalinus]
MQGLNPPRTKNAIDEIFDLYEDVLKQKVALARNEVKKQFSQFERIQNQKAKDLIKERAFKMAQGLQVDVYQPVVQLLQTVEEQAFKYEFSQKEPAQVLYPNREGEVCPKITGKDRNINENKIQFAKLDEKLHDQQPLVVDRYQDFVNFPLRKVGSVRQLTINCNSQGIGDYGMDHFAEKLAKFINMEQVVINLATNNISHIGGAKLGNAFYGLKKLRSINLNLYNNKIKQKGLDSIMKNFAQLPHLNQLNLEIACNVIGNNGIENLGKYVNQMRSLNKLWLGVYDNSIYEDGMKEFLHQFSQWPVYKTLMLDFRVNPLSKKNLEQLKTIIRHKKIIDFEIKH